ncbi:hypothetical protein M9H77_36464 [Catharanthus roseus]|uniref:Uncharacterized protein n=1 Tax=Catharanthus roseus TaxID=4058 RepID=A0ACB9ZTN7_CATRO|nr:hypothetical protein M9H77_36464 [Catharanthus roseus]
MSDQKKDSAMEEKRRVKCECEKSVVSSKESEGKRKESECVIENHESLNEKQVKEIIQSQFLDYLTTICGTKLNHGMKAKGEGTGKELSIGYEDTSINSTQGFHKSTKIKVGYTTTQ